MAYSVMMMIMIMNFPSVVWLQACALEHLLIAEDINQAQKAF
jgi:hypothetical protein